MRGALLGAAAAALAVPAAAQPCPWGPYPGNESIVLAPDASKATGKPALLLYVPGGQVPNWYYVNTTKVVQRRTAGYIDLYVAIITCPYNLCMPQPGSIDEQMANATAAVNKMVGGSGIPPELVFVGGHSLGATTADLWARNHSSEASGGVLLYGGVIDYGMMASYPLPLALIAAELDFGAGRFTKQAHYYKDALEWAGGDDEKMFRHKSVFALARQDHSDFCRGFPVRGDLPTETDSDDFVHQNTGGVTAEWLLLHSGQPAAIEQEAISALRYRKVLTDAFLAPFLKLWELEQGGWCEQAQRTIAQSPEPLDGTAQVRPEQLNVRVRHTLEQDDGSGYGENCTYPNPCGFQELHVNYTGGVNSSTPDHLNIEIDSFNWLWPNGSNVGKHVSAMAVGCKLISRQRIRQQLGMSTPNDTANACMEVNEKALQLAIDTVPASSVARWRKVGKPLYFADDFSVQYNSGVFWLKQDPFYNETDANMTVAMPKLYSEVDVPPVIFSGVHYCKLVSPAWFADWIMYDSLTSHAYGTGTGNWTA